MTGQTDEARQLLEQLDPESEQCHLLEPGMHGFAWCGADRASQPSHMTVAERPVCETCGRPRCAECLDRVRAGAA